MRDLIYKRQIRVSSEDLRAVQDGRKLCTIRLGTASVASPQVDLTDGHNRTRVRIIQVDSSKTFGGITDREIRGEGFNTQDELEADLRKYYRGLTPDSPITVIWFEVLP